MRIQSLEHALERSIYEFLLFDILDIVLLNHIEHLTETPQRIVVGVCAACAHHSAPGKKKTIAREHMDKNLNTLCIPPSRTGEKYFNRQYTATVHDPDIPASATRCSLWAESLT